MGTYIGSVQITGNFYNFKPLIEVDKRGNFNELYSRERQDLLPQSQKENINMFYSPARFEDRMNETFFTDQLVIMEFEPDDLLDNIYNDVRNQTGYKVNAEEYIRAKKIRSINFVDCFRIVDLGDFRNDFFKDKVVELSGSDYVADERIFVKIDNNFMAGPYKVGLRTYGHVFYIKPEIKESKYTISGYSRRDFKIHNIYDKEDMWDDVYQGAWQIYELKKEPETLYKDLIDDTLLLQSFKDTLPKDDLKNGYLSLENAESILNRYNESLLSSGKIDQTIQENRMTKLKDIILSEKNIDDVVNQITDILSDLLIKNRERPSVVTLINNLVEQHPELLDKLQNMRIFQDRLESVKEEIESLEESKNNLLKNIKDLEVQQVEVSEKNTQAIQEEKRNIDEEYNQKVDALEKISQRLSLITDVESLIEQKESLDNEIHYLEHRKYLTEEEMKDIESQFVQKVQSYHDKMVDIAFDGFMANKMIGAAAKWEEEDGRKTYDNAVISVRNLGKECPVYQKDELVQYICTSIQKVRPDYSRNHIINIFTCISQGFLTVFSGKPGCGKTSICNIVGDVLGLNSINKLVTDPNGNDLNRYVSVSVERGWTSKRDFIGYYNPLNKTFDKSNSQVYDALKILNIEAKDHASYFPYLILLDEANLSPMEYYWADFMNVCDDINNSKINLGEDNIFSIPETLHFLATINNDHTTEVLSPRLIDRAWIIKLPSYSGRPGKVGHYQEGIKLISWENIKEVFCPSPSIDMDLSAEVKRIYFAIIEHFEKQDISISPRIDIAIRNYWKTAASLMESDEYDNDAEIVALDFAVSQKILPKISGNGDAYFEWLKGLRTLFEGNNLMMSAEIVKTIIDKGISQMKYFQYF